LQEACFKVYNDWLLEYCAAAPERLFGVACISAYRIDEAVKEMERCKKLGIKGILIWQAPPEEQSFATGHHDAIFEAAQAMDMPVSLHILTGAPYKPGWDPRGEPPVEFQNTNINDKLHHAVKTLIGLVISGTFDRFPRLKVITVENEVSWQPFIIWQMEKYAGKKYRSDYPMKLKPSEYFQRNLFTTFFNDPAAGDLIANWGADTWMWSNDYPHPNSTWPNSREVIQRDLGHLPDSVRVKVLRDTVARVYNLPKILPLAVH
jgi:predicted TIM-barrel fold metal-dependent hydrolase